MLHKNALQAHLPAPGEQFDVVVAGGGPAGIGAALAASSMGAKTLLLEARPYLGGVASTSLWMPVNRLRLDGGKRGFTHDMFVEKIESYGSDAYQEGKVTWVDGDGLHIHPDFLRLALFELLEESGCKYRLYSPVSGALVEDGRLTQALVSTKEGNQVFSAKAFVDASGDGDLSYHAGATVFTSSDDQGQGAFMPITLGFMLANVNTQRLFAFYNSDEVKRFPQIIRQAEEMGLCVSTFYSFDRTSIPGVVSVNNGGLKGVGPLNALHPGDHTLSERVGIQIAHDFIRFARQLIPGLENCSLVRVGSAVGVRETRRIEGDYVVTLQDASTGAEFADVVARRYGAVDQAGLTKEHPAMQSGYAFPYRALLVKGIEGLLVAGRCGSYTHDGLAAGKSMGNMMAIGQAAGAAAALSAAMDTTPRQLDYHLVQDALRARGAKL